MKRMNLKTMKKWISRIPKTKEMTRGMRIKMDKNLDEINCQTREDGFEKTKGEKRRRTGTWPMMKEVVCQSDEGGDSLE
jgi:hypothetical protein